MQLIESHIPEALVLAFGTFLAFLLHDRVKNPRVGCSLKRLCEKIPVKKKNGVNGYDYLSVIRLILYNSTTSTINNIEVSLVSDHRDLVKRCWILDGDEHEIPYACKVAAKSTKEIIIYYQSIHPMRLNNYPQVRCEGINVAPDILTRGRIFKIQIFKFITR